MTYEELIKRLTNTLMEAQDAMSIAEDEEDAVVTAYFYFGKITGIVDILKELQ